MTNLSNLIGEYQYTNKVLTNSLGLKLLIRNRSNTSKTKTPLFLLDKTTPAGSYISSLYPSGDAAFKFDYKKINYELKIDELKGKAFISQCQSALYINSTL
jgi:hypothetical protein